MATDRENKTKRQERDRRLYESRRDSGLCVKCGVPVTNGLARCEKHKGKRGPDGVSASYWRNLTSEQRFERNVRAAMRKYGLTREEVLAHRQATCPVCGKEATVIDHNHQTGQVRGALCKSCNVAIGLLNDDPERLARAIEYLRRYAV